MALKIWIDAGHGAGDSGAVHRLGRKESDDNLAYANDLARQFRAKGYVVIMPRTAADQKIDISQRCKIERDNRCALALSCHRNGGIPLANGFEVWVHSRAPESFIGWGKNIAARVAKLGMRTRGVFRGAPSYTDFGVNSNTTSPSMLIELGFVSSDSDNAIFDAKLPQLCTAIVEGCEIFLKERGTIK